MIASSASIVVARGGFLLRTRLTQYGAKMDACIVCDDYNLAEKIRQLLLALKVDCTPERILNTLSMRNAAETDTVKSQIVFIVATTLSDEEAQLIRFIKTRSTPHLAVVSTGADHASVLKMIRAGADDYLDFGGDLGNEISDFVSRVIADRTRSETKGQLISVVPCHVPSDAGIVAVNASAVIAKYVGSCCLIDFQLRGGDLALLLKLRPDHTVCDLISQSQQVENAMFQRALVSHESGIRLLAGPEVFSDLRNIDPRLCQEILHLAQACYPFVVVNTEDIQHEEQIHALTSSSHVLVAIRLDLLSLYRAQRYIDFMVKSGVSPEHIHVVALGTGHSGELTISAVKKALRVSRVHCIPDDPEAITVSINVGNPLVLESPKSKISQSLTKLIVDISGLDCGSSGERKDSGLVAAKAAALVAINAVPFFK
jgi:pilus assembly protein CpaE